MRAAEAGAAYTVVYDGQCDVCRGFVARLEKWDSAGQLEIVPAQAPGVHSRFPWIDAREYADSMQLVRAADGKTWQGAAAMEQLLDVLPRGRWIAWVFHLPFARVLADSFYRWFARNRYRMSCRDHCRTHPRPGSE